MISPLALKAGATAEAGRQLAFLSGPLARDEHVVGGARCDLIGRLTRLHNPRLGYSEGALAFVLAADETKVAGMTVLTVLKRLAASTYVPPPTGTRRYITPTGAGDWSGSNWENAGPLDNLNTFVAAMGAAGGDVLLAAHLGPYYRNGQLSISNAGTADRYVAIKGVDADGNPAIVEINGARANPWSIGSANGAEVFRLVAGWSYLAFENIRFNDQGYGCIRFAAPGTGFRIDNCHAVNVRAFIDNNATGGITNASVSQGLITNCTGLGYSKHFARFKYASSFIRYEDCHADSQSQDGDNFCNGFVIEDGPSHDFYYLRCTSENHLDTIHSYWNGDGFCTEGANYNITFEDCQANNNSDGGFDCKSEYTIFIRCGGTGNKKTFRIWGRAYIYGLYSTNPFKRGGSGAPSHVATFEKGIAFIISGEVSQTSDSSQFVAESGGRTFLYPDVFITAPGTAPLYREEENGRFAIANTADTSAPVMDSTVPRAYTIAENRLVKIPLTANKLFGLRLIGADADAGYVFPSGSDIIVRPLDFENPDHGPAYAFTARLYSDMQTFNDYAFTITVTDVDDRPIDVAELMAQPGVTDGWWHEPRDLSTLFLDTAGTVPYSSSNEDHPIVRFVADKTGCGNHLRSEIGYTLETIPGGYKLSPLEGAFFTLGDPGDLRYAKVTAGVALIREGGETARQTIISVPRSLTPGTPTNAVWQMIVEGGQAFQIRTPAGNMSAPSSGNFGQAKKLLVLGMESETGKGFSNGTNCIDGADYADMRFNSSGGNTYPATGQPRMGADGNGSQILIGDFIGSIGVNATLASDEENNIRHRVWLQLGEMAGMTF